MARSTKKKLPQPDITQLLHDIHSYNVNVHTREIFLHGNISDSAEEDPGIDYRMAVVFLKNLTVLEQLGWSKVVVRMHSVGGEWPDGMGIYNAIQNAKSNIAIVAYAQASSMSGVILQSADQRVLMPDTHFMLHYGSIEVDGTSQSVDAAVKQNNEDNRRMLEIFSERALEGPFFRKKRWGIKRVTDYIDHEMKTRGDWYLTAEDAVQLGFADGILGENDYKI